MARKMRVSEEEKALVLAYREGLAAKSKEETKKDEKKEEEETMDIKKGLKITAIASAALAGVAGGIYGIYKIFFEDPAGLSVFDDSFDEAELAQTSEPTEETSDAPVES